MTLADSFSYNFADSYETAPTAAKTSNELAGASSGLERLLNLAVGGYVAVTNAKATTQQQKLKLSNATAPIAPGVTEPTKIFGMDQKTVLLGGAALLGFLVVGKMLRR